MKIRVFYSVSLIGLLVGAAFSGLFTNIVRAADDAIAIIDEELLDLINQYADDYYKPEWNVTLDQYKAWIATIAWSEGNRGGYVAHSQWNPGSDVFYHKIVGGKFRFSTGIGPFQLDFHGGNWPTIKKLNITKALLDVLIWHYNKFGKDDNLSKFSKESDWNGVKPGRIETRWREVTGTEWRDHKDGKNINLKWTEVVNRIAIKEDPRYSYKDNIKYMGKVKWNIDKSEGIKTDAGKKVILDGYFPTWLVNARDDTGTKLFDYYYTYNESSRCEVWVWNNVGAENELRYIFIRNYTKSPNPGIARLPEHRIGNYAGENKLKKPALNVPKGDVVFVFDATGSMGWIIGEMQSKAVDIMNEIRVAIPDTRFGVGSFTDYPGYYESYGYNAEYGGVGDYAWQMDLDLTYDISDAQNAISNIVYGWGADGPQDYTRVVYETTTFSWRPDAIKIVVLFGDAPPHSAPSGRALMCPWNPSEKLFSSSYGGDPGSDGVMFTGDDLDYGPVVDQIADEDIIFICVDCQPDTGYNYAEDAHNNFRYLAYKTGGSVFGYESEGVADEIINRVLREERSFYFIQLTDTHYGYDGARKRVKWLIKSIAQLNPKPAFVIISGDLLSWGADSDNMPLLSWPFTEEENNSYSKLKEDLETLTDTGIPYYVCIGNHDYRHWPVQTDYISGWIPYYLVFGNLQYSTTTNDLHIVALNSGPDNLVAGTYFPPKGRGLSEDDLNWLENDLDSLDGIMNGRDDSKLKKLIFMHHPTINYMDDAWPFPGWGAGCISNNRQEFMNLCTQYNVDAILSGHIHWNRVYDRSMDGSTSPEYQNGYNDGSGDPAKFPLSTFDKTLYVDTGAAYLCEYRMIKCKSDGLIVWREDTVIDTVTGKIYGCPVILHLYDEDNSHVGRNEMGGVDFEIENTTYLLEPVTNTSEVNPAKWNHTIEEISLPYGIDTYRYEIEAMGNGSFNFSLDKHLTDGSKLNLLYRNISVTNGSKGILYVAKDSIDYTIYFDDNRDGVIDREIQPDNVVTNNVPYRPEKPNGPPLGDVGVLYTYSTSTMDPEGDQVYYWWDWGDGTNSGWLGPYYSGEVIEASHVWNEPGVYEIKVKAKDGYGHVSDWSPSLTFQTDITPPITTKTIAEPKYGENDEWVTSDTRFNLTATDDISGVKATYYRIWYNGTWSGWLEYTGNFILFGEGKHYLEYYSVDNAGNQEEIHNQTHYVDDTPPVTIISLEYGDGVTWVFDPETGRMKPHREIRCVTLIADDNGGVDHCIVYWATRDPFGHLEWHSHPDSVTFKGDIVKNVAMFYSVDALSNREEPRRADRAIPIF